MLWLPPSFIQRKGKHCRKPHCLNGFADTFEHYHVSSEIYVAINFVLNLVIVLNFESFFSDLLATFSLGNKMDAKVSTKTKTMTVPDQNLFRYIGF